MPALPLPEFTDRRHRPAGHQAADAGMVPRHASARPGQEGAVQYRAGPAARDFGQCCLAGPAQADAGDDRTRPPYKLGAAGPRVEIDDAYIGGERTGEGTGRGRRGHTPFIIAVETSADRRPLHARLQVVRGFQTGETKRLCARIEAGTILVSDGGQWFRCIAEQPGIIHERHITGSGRASARHPAFRWANTLLANIKNSLLATHRAVAAKHLPRYLGAFAWRFNRRFVLKTIHERLAITAAATPPMPYRLLKLAEARW